MSDVTRLPSGLYVVTDQPPPPPRNVLPGPEEWGDWYNLPVRVRILDTETGERKWHRFGNHTAAWWATGNGSCDCNRHDGYNGTGVCEGCKRYLIDAVEPNLWNTPMREFNDGYPDELLARLDRAERCWLCHKPAPHDQPDAWYGPRSWVRQRWSCRHETSLECPDCTVATRFDGPFDKCSVCGCTEQFT